MTLWSVGNISFVVFLIAYLFTKRKVSMIQYRGSHAEKQKYKQSIRVMRFFQLLWMISIIVMIYGMISISK